MFAHCCVLNLKLCSLRQNTVRGSMKNCSGWIIDHQQACVKYTGTMRAVSISRKLTLYVDILQIETSLLKDVDIICQHIALLRPCLNNYLIYWSLPWCCTRAMKLVHLPGGELIKYKYFWITQKPEILLLWIIACWRCLEYPRVKHNLYILQCCALCWKVTLDRVLALDLIESERSPPRFFTAPAKIK